MKCKFDYSKLRGLIITQFGTLSNFCDENQICLKVLSAKLNNRTGFSQDDITTYQTILGIPDENLSDYFFTPKELSKT